MTIRRLVTALCAALTLLTLVGCVSVPSDGPVVVVSQRAHSQEPRIDIRPLPPAANADQREVVNGFLVAMADSGGDWSVARQYLTPEASRQWRPDHGIRVYASSSYPHQTDNSIAIDGTVTGTVDQRGAYVAKRQTLHHDFELTKSNGQWRINNPPDGLLVSTTLIATNYAAASIYFFDSTLSTLVPDVVYLPRQQVTPTELVRRVVAGPTDWLAPAVHPAVGPDAVLTPDPVSVAADGLATISFISAEAPLDSEDGRVRLAAQIALTLRRNLASVTGIALEAGGEPLSLPGAVNGNWALNRADPYDPLTLRPIPDLFAVQSDRLGRISEAFGRPRWDPLTGALGQAGLTIDEVAVALDGGEVAVVTGGHTTLQRGKITDQSPPIPLLSAKGLLTPQYSRFGELWAMATFAGVTRVWVYRDGAPVEVTAPALADVAVSDFRLSPDGTRMLVIGTKGGAPVTGMVQVRRGEEVSLESWRGMDLLTDSLENFQSIAVGWRSDTQLILLGQDPQTDAVHPYELDCNAQTVTAGTANLDGEWLATMPFGRFSAVVLARDGTLLRRSDTSRWPSYATDWKITAIAYPG